jgi:hypothetical protein
MKRQKVMGRWSFRLPLAMALLASVLIGNSNNAHADMLLKGATTFVMGKSTDTYSFDAPGAGTITAMVSSAPWPTPLSSLSFDTTTATDVLAQASVDPSGSPQAETFTVSGAGTYFAHVSAVAGANQFGVGVYSLMVMFTPSAVPLPGAVGLLLLGLFVVLALRSTMRPPRNESVMYPA